MVETYYTLLTSGGIAKLTNAQITQTAVNITHLAVGDGDGSYYNPTESATKLKKERWRGLVSKVEQDPNNPNWIVVEITIPATAGGFMIREVGIFDSSNTLIAIGKYPETYKPLVDSGSSKDLIIKMVIQVSNASAISINVDPNVITASRQWTTTEIENVHQPTAAAVAEMASKIRALTYEQERMNKQALLQGQATISGGTHNGYFRTASAFASIAFGGYGQKNAPNYEVILTPVSGDLAMIGDLVAYDKTQNGFKVKMTGSAPSVTFIWTLINKLI